MKIEKKYMELVNNAAEGPAPIVAEKEVCGYCWDKMGEWFLNHLPRFANHFSIIEVYNLDSGEAVVLLPATGETSPSLCWWCGVQMDPLFLQYLQFDNIMSRILKVENYQKARDGEMFIYKMNISRIIGDLR